MSAYIVSYFRKKSKSKSPRFLSEALQKLSRPSQQANATQSLSALGFQGDLRSELPERVAMEQEPCQWFLLKLSNDDFAIQYEGPDPEIEFPVSLKGYFPH